MTFNKDVLLEVVTGTLDQVNISVGGLLNADAV
jgi:hypothetical protein